MVLGAFQALKENNLRVPEDTAILGFDDPEWAPFTTIRQPTYHIGTIACQALLQRIRQNEHGELYHEDIVIKPQLIVRESCGAQLSIKRG